MRWTGGCQCGAVRYEMTEAPHQATLCHCRMCQKATGGAYLASASVGPGGFRWTRGAPAEFRSSSAAVRGFCARCGTPLFWRATEGGDWAISLGSLDDPEAVSPGRQIGIEARRSWWAGHGLSDGLTTNQDSPSLIDGLQDYQHPDHDTEEWTLR